MNINRGEIYEQIQSTHTDINNSSYTDIEYIQIPTLRNIGHVNIAFILSDTFT